MFLCPRDICRMYNSAVLTFLCYMYIVNTPESLMAGWGHAWTLLYTGNNDLDACKGHLKPLSVPTRLLYWPSTDHVVWLFFFFFSTIFLIFYMNILWYANWLDSFILQLLIFSFPPCFSTCCSRGYIFSFPIFFIYIYKWISLLFLPPFVPYTVYFVVHCCDPCAVLMYLFCFSCVKFIRKEKKKTQSDGLECFFSFFVFSLM